MLFLKKTKQKYKNSNEVKKEYQIYNHLLSVDLGNLVVPSSWVLVTELSHRVFYSYMEIAITSLCLDFKTFSHVFIFPAVRPFMTYAEGLL